jgi:hypothetical protein
MAMTGVLSNFSRLPVQSGVLYLACVLQSTEAPRNDRDDPAAFLVHFRWPDPRATSRHSRSLAHIHYLTHIVMPTFISGMCIHQ